MNQSTHGPNETNLSETIHRLMRTLRRQPAGHPHHARGSRRLLKALNQIDGASARELSDFLGIRPASLAELLSKTESRGLIRRVRDEEDHRISHIYLAEAGRQILMDMITRSDDESVFSGILTKEETRLLISLCNKLTAGMERKLQEAAPDGGTRSPSGPGPDRGSEPISRHPAEPATQSQRDRTEADPVRREVD